jgi:hypothetical protein
VSGRSRTGYEKSISAFCPKSTASQNRSKLRSDITCCPFRDLSRGTSNSPLSFESRCESALEKLRARQEGATFNRSRPDIYSLTGLNDLAGVRVLAFPRSRLDEIDRNLRGVFPSWTSDPIEEDGELQAHKYYGYCEASDRVKGEYQIVSMLTGLFWEVEHAAIYKPDPRLRRIALHRGMQERTRDVAKALKAFEEDFESLARQD